MTRAILALLWLLHLLPLGVLAAIGSAAGSAAFWLVRERRRVTRINLALCFPDMPEARREQLARAHFRAFVRSVVERSVLWWAPRERIMRLARVEGMEHLRALAGRPVILLAPHFVGMDAGWVRLTCELDMAGIYAGQKDAQLSARLLAGRTRFGDQRTYSRQDGIRRPLADLKAGRPFYYLPDMDYGPRDAIFVPFFGVPAATVPGVARLARVARARVLPCVTSMLPGGEGYLVRIEPAWEGFPSGDLHADTRRMNEYIERLVLQMPEQYLWMHKRFKTRPPGEERFYP